MRVYRPPLLTLLSSLLFGNSGSADITHFGIEPVAGNPAGRKVASLTAVLPSSADHIVEDSTNLLTWHRISPVLRASGSPLNWSHTQFDLTVSAGGDDLYGTGNAASRTRRFYRTRQLTAADERFSITGAPVPPFGRLTRIGSGGGYRLTTTGGWTILINGTTLTITNPSGRDNYEMWGSGSGGTGHENLNGKHIKDNMGGARTILLPDGTIVTVLLSTVPGTNTINSFSIYDGDQSHRLTSSPDGNGNPNTVIMSAGLRRAGERAEADGETCRILDTPTGMYYENIYIQSVPDAQPVPQEAVPLGRTGGPANPNQVNDYYDDPRLSYT